MSDLQARFDEAVAQSKTLPERPDNFTLLRIYALFKQGTEGDVSGTRPGMTDFVGRAKFDAWEMLKGKSKEEAQEAYVALVDELKG
ncbi:MULTISPECIES: acyl-CoA-binding protein [Pandoraea]|uniref:Acyl-CoA-binding protein n=3 Tax=Pandoraea TaxID=93217 RepID=A0A5E4Y6W5_9BURK|nr:MULTISPECIES: acyl-CoA-binding protein [Pandoraea]EON10944.1 acyl-CoA-binding protein [Pandoraea sp. SD6-2]MDM8359378.1 acyl-CoA-binding protein [Pandoraea communis]QHE93488.1 acyl-CoA-binding protein [Pandoraea fibrosis]QHF12950.1 acyl-CoA-binding protein [Pandoraea fibrosis]VVE22979.1 acyl-CoA-binding protein [Pandoraea communis]